MNVKLKKEHYGRQHHSWGVEILGNVLAVGMKNIFQRNHLPEVSYETFVRNFNSCIYTEDELIV